MPTCKLRLPKKKRINKVGPGQYQSEDEQWLISKQYDKTWLIMKKYEVHHDTPSVYRISYETTGIFFRYLRNAQAYVKQMMDINKEREDAKNDTVQIYRLGE